VNLNTLVNNTDSVVLYTHVQHVMLCACLLNEYTFEGHISLSGGGGLKASCCCFVTFVWS